MSSLVGMALRMTARRLLDETTFAGGRVHDSAIAPIDHMVEKGNDEPFIVISTEDEEAIQIQGRDINGGHRKIDLVIEVAIAHAVSAPVPAPEGEEGEPPAPEVEIVIPATDAGMELSLSLIGRQIMRALFEQKDSPWAVLFKRFCINVEKVSNRRGVGNKVGARFAARQIIISIECLQEPFFGHEPEAGEPWGDFLAQMLDDPELAEIEPLVRATITGKPEIEAWDRGRSDQGLTKEAAENIGIRMAGDLDEGPPLLQDGTLDDVE